MIKVVKVVIAIVAALVLTAVSAYLVSRLLSAVGPTLMAVDAETLRLLVAGFWIVFVGVLVYFFIKRKRKHKARA